MESSPQPARGQLPLGGSLVAAAARRAADAAEADAPAAAAIDLGVGTLYDAVPGLLPSVFVLEHGRLWLVAQRGYAVVPDGIRIERGVMGRAVRLGAPQRADDVRSDPDYVPALPGVGCELALPLRFGELVVGALNLESERPLPENAAELLEPLTLALAPLTEALRRSRKLDLPALARLFVHLGSLRDPNEIAEIAAASLSKVLPVETSQVVLWSDLGGPTELASWCSESTERSLFAGDELEAARALVDPTVVCQLLDLGPRRTGDRGATSLVWLPLRANGAEIGAVVAASLPDESVDPVDLDTAALLAAHVAASLDAAFAFQRERRSAMTDALTGVLNRRGLEERIEQELALAKERRLPLSLIVLDCDDFKEINDRAGHGFGDSLLQEVAHLLARGLPPAGAAARLGGDEFVVMLPGADIDEAAELGSRIREVLSESLTDAGYPLRVSAGISTFPYDGVTPTALLRTADQALYAAKNAGKNRVASFRDIVKPDATFEAQPYAGGSRRRRADGSILAEVMAATVAIDREEDAEGLCNRLCKALVFAVGVTACTVSRVVGEHLVDLGNHSLRDVWVGDDAAYRIADFPLTAQVLETGEPRAASFLDGDVDPAEAFVLRQLEMNAILMLPLRVEGEAWGLIELYEMRLRRFSEDDVAVAQFLAAHAERRLAVVGTRTPLRPLPPAYELPREEAKPRGPRTR